MSKDKHIVKACGDLGASQQSLNPFLLIVYGMRRGRGVTDGIKADPRP